MKKVRIGLVGCGNISDTYLTNIPKYNFMEIVACCDLNEEAAQRQAKKYQIPKVCSMEELMSDPEIDVVLNLTTPKAHASVILAALEHGKHAYTEKPLAVTMEEGKSIVKKARETGLRVGCAPDTFLGGRIQTIRKMLDDQWIGKPIAAEATVVLHGHEHWHPNPAFLYQKGAGPLMDMGPYYVTALLYLMGPVKRISGSAQISTSQRMIRCKQNYGQMFDVEVPTHVSAILEFVNGGMATLTTSFDIWDAHLPRLEIYGTDGTIAVIDNNDPSGGPNLFGGEIQCRRAKDSDWTKSGLALPRPNTEWTKVPTVYGYNENDRGIGLADMCNSMLNGTSHKASLEMAYHALEVMLGIYTAAETGVYYTPESTFERAELLPANKAEYKF